MGNQVMKKTEIIALLLCAIPLNVSANTVIECQNSSADKLHIINGLEVTETNWPPENIGSLTFKLSGDEGVELIAASSDFELEREIISKQEFRFDGDKYFGGGIFVIDDYPIEIRSALSKTQFLFFVSGHKGNPHQVVVGQVNCFQLYK